MSLEEIIAQTVKTTNLLDVIVINMPILNVDESISNSYWHPRVISTSKTNYIGVNCYLNPFKLKEKPIVTTLLQKLLSTKHYGLVDFKLRENPFCLKIGYVEYNFIIFLEKENYIIPFTYNANNNWEPLPDTEAEEVIEELFDLRKKADNCNCDEENIVIETEQRENENAEDK